MTMEKWAEANPCPQSRPGDGRYANESLLRARSGKHGVGGKAGSTCTWLVVERELRGLHSLVGPVLTQFHSGTGVGGPVQSKGVEGPT